MTRETLPTEVDVFQLQQTVTWLQDTKTYVDEKIVAHLKTIPPIVGNAPTNVHDDAPTMPSTVQPTTTTTGGGTVTGLIESVGTTHFGTFPNGALVANKHAQTYNAVLTGLDTISKNLGKAIEATNLILTNYTNVDDATAAEVAQLFTSDAPYEPGSGTREDRPPGSGSRSYYI